MIPGHMRGQEPAPILILGYMHSGTTLLQQILGRHPDVFISGGETRFFINFSAIVRRFPDLENERTLRRYVEYLLKVIFAGYANVNFTRRVDYKPIDLENYNITPADVEQLLNQARYERSHASTYRIAFGFVTNKHGKKRWLDKLAGYVSQVEIIRSVLPDAQVIELVRDPRDILASKKRRAANGGNYDPVWDSLAWTTAVRAGIEAREKSPACHLRVRYEDLVSKPQETTKTICQYLELEYDPDMLSVGWINSTAVDRQKASNQVGTDAVGKWRTLLPDADLAVCQWLAGKAMLGSNYELEPVSSLVYFMLPVVFLRSGAEFFFRLYHKWRRGGTDLLRSVFSNYRLRFFRLINP